MASSLKTTLIDTDFKHWLKGALAVLFAREGLVDFVENEIIAYQIDLLNDVRMLSRIPPRTICSSCTTANILVCPATGFCCWKNNKCNMHDPNISSSMPDQPCPVGLCTALRDAIRNEHRYRGPSWRNTDTTKWCTDAYQIAKNFMPPDGYSDNASFAETDFNGVLAVVMNNKQFQKKMSTNLSNKSNICEDARKAGRKIRHAPKHQLKYTELVSCIDVFIQLLSDAKCLATDAKAKDAVNKLNQLKTNTLMIYADDITKVLNDFIKEKFDDQQNKLINEIDRHFRAHEKDSIDAIDRKVQDLANTHIDKLKSQTEKGIAELTKHEEKGKVEIYNYTSIQIKKEKDKLHAHTEKEKEGLSLYNKQLKQELEDKSVVLYSRTVNEVTKEIHEETERVKQELDTHSKKLREEANKSALLNTGKTDDQSVKGEENTISLFEWFWDLLPFKEYQLRSELKEALARFYLEKESMIPASPLVEDHAVPLAELYVQPPMSAFIKPNAFGQGKSLAQTTTVSSYQKLFLNHDNVLFKNIYVEANAGYGKTSFTQKVAMTWCQAQKPDHSLNSKFVQNDFDTLERIAVPVTLTRLPG